jgi:hypothetical protein
MCQCAEGGHTLSGFDTHADSGTTAVPVPEKFCPSGEKVHRLFVVDDAGTLVGVISALDVLRHLRE